MNDWMDQEVLRQAAEAGDPAAETTSCALPARRQGAPVVGVFLVIGIVTLLAVLAVVATAALH